MTETTQETIKFARNWLENGIEDEPSPVTVHELAKAVVELADEVKKLESINMDHLEELDRQEWLLDNANEELTALKEKYRWRKQSEEPAPDSLEIEIYDISANAIFVPEGPVYIANSRYWRPLDLPNLPEEDGGDNDKN